MVKKAQIRFIVLTMSILFVVFAVSFITASFFLNKEAGRNINTSLNETERVYLVNDLVREKGLVVIGTYTTEQEQDTEKIFIKDYDCSSRFSGDYYSPSTVDKIIKEVMEKEGTSTGDYENIFYKATVLQEKISIFGYNAEEDIKILKSNMLKLLIVLIVIFILVFLIVLMFSYKIIRPIRETLNIQRQFVSNASHELKTPITIISANADVIKNTNNSEWIENIKSQTERMELLVTDMLTLAKADEDRLPQNPSEFNLSDAISESALPFDALAFENGKELEFDIAENIKYVGDVDSVKKIVNILLDNAIKYSSDKGKIKISLKKDNKTLSLSVFNTGSQIDDFDSNKIFERFYRGDNSRNRSTGGSGLGLAIARSICIANKWKISALSKKDESMTITVIF